MAGSKPHISASPDSDFMTTVPYAQNRFPEPVRRPIPPPRIDFVSGQPVLSNTISQEPESHDYGTSEYGNPEFLQSLRATCNGSFDHQMLSWEYPMRRTAQAILPFLFLGPTTVARDIQYVRNAGITMMISVRSAVAARANAKYMDASTFASSDGLTTLTLDLDTPFDLITRLPQTLKAMNDHLEENCVQGPSGNIVRINGKILVFCESGNERSTALVAAYLMVLFGIDVVNAMQIIQSQRFCIAPEDGMKNMLTTFEGVLKAKRDVTMQRLQGLRDVIAQKPKRNVNMVYEDEEEGMTDGDEQTQEDGSRKNWAPFQSK